MSNFFLNHYLKHTLRHELTELYASVAIKNFAFSMIVIFEPIYLYTLYDSLAIVFMYYAVAYTLYFFTVSIGAKAAAKYGFEHCIFYSIPFGILYFLSLSQLPNYPWLIFVAIILMVIYKSLFWPSYHTDFAHYGVSGFKGREISALAFILTIATILGPIIGGIILVNFSFQVLFIVVSTISLISAIPLFATREQFIPHHFSYKDSFKRFLKPYGNYKRNDSIAYFGFGEEVIAAVGWPIFVYLIIEKFDLMGVIMSVVIFSIAIISLYMGKLSDVLRKRDKKKLVTYGTMIYVIAWILRPFSANWLGVLLVDIMSKGSKTAINNPLLTYIYSAGKNHKGFLKYNIFCEMSLSAGKALAAWGVALIAIIWGYYGNFDFWFVSFAFAGVWSLFYLFKFYES
ncbi:MAG: MFS transporter [Candidatus Pacebacteria bacterium]|nr:MFS transporter [Candidatus Paceibacterota bacterium]